MSKKYDKKTENVTQKTIEYGSIKKVVYCYVTNYSDTPEELYEFPFS